MVFHLLPQGLQTLLLDAADLALGEPQRVGGLLLGQVPEKQQVQHLLLQGGQRPRRLGQGKLILDGQLERLIGQAVDSEDVNLVKAHQTGPHDLADALRPDVEGFGQPGNRGGTAIPPDILLQGGVHPELQLLDAAGAVEGGLAAHQVADLPHNTVGGVGGEADGSVRVVAVQCLQHRQTARLKQILPVTGPAVELGIIADQAEGRRNRLAAGLLAPVPKIAPGRFLQGKKTLFRFHATPSEACRTWAASWQSR